MFDRQISFKSFSAKELGREVARTAVERCKRVKGQRRDARDPSSDGLAIEWGHQSDSHPNADAKTHDAAESGIVWNNGCSVRGVAASRRRAGSLDLRRAFKRDGQAQRGQLLGDQLGMLAMCRDDE